MAAALSLLALIFLLPFNPCPVAHAFSSVGAGGGGSINSTSNKNDAPRKKKIPITVLSGFLGSGKTTLLRHLLNNGEGTRIAVIVNDVASVNIDSKLVRNLVVAGDDGRGGSATENAPPAGIVELQNGCACCSLSDELLPSVMELVTLSDLRGEEGSFDHIVIEMSGVAEPRSVRSNFQDAVYYGMPLMERVGLDTMVTVVDCGSYLQHLRSGQGATPKDAPELFYRDPSDVDRAAESDDDWAEGLSEKLLDALNAGRGGDGSPGGGVADLIVEQTEVADVILLNKSDQIDDDPRTMSEIERVVQALNPRAKVLVTSYGEVESLEDVLGAAGGNGVADLGVVDDHRDSVEAAVKGEGCTDPDCVDPTHDHGHSHEHSAQDRKAQSDGTGCTDPTHDHSHSHRHGAEGGAASAECTDASHSHSHDHRGGDAGAKAESQYGGIGTYVYRARRPFHPGRLASFLRHMPVVRGLPPSPSSLSSKEGTARKSSKTMDEEHSISVSERTKEVLACLLRSKGFVWCADSNLAALYWSHAGGSFEMQCLGRWWATLAKDQWPQEAREAILADFDDPNHVEISPSSSSSVGDRRQEIVFIGSGIGSPQKRAEISDTLDACLLSDAEWQSYCSMAGDEKKLRGSFVNPLQSRMLSY